MEDHRRSYFCCANCHLVFVPREQFLSASEEKAEYDLHQNSPDDSGYRRFLSRLFVPVRDRLAPDSVGLDFGSGPGPTLSLMFEEAGYPMEIYDPSYADEPSVLERSYAFITVSETAEHFHDPRKEFDRLWRILRPGGILGVLTQLVIDHDAFANWRYKNDPTHVSFYSRKTFAWLESNWGAKMTFVGKDVMLFVKDSAGDPDPTSDP